MVSLGDNSKMRGDIPLYVIAIVCFASAIGLYLTMYEATQAYIVTLAVLGVIFLGAGYSMRPKAIAETEVIETEKESVTREEVVTETEVKPSLELTDVKGIGPKRAEQLKKIGIKSVEDLASESSEELSKKVNVSAKLADKWIKAAKKALEE
ncbi:hypothetical protein DRO54_02940 [Candidatus Bathyarchaeota archaeon]|nr:MAG: hypothetical protein DRO54_02940 [Candidatus Bathyarchaeota archaeon]